MSIGDHQVSQQLAFDSCYRETRSYWFSDDAMTRYITLWRLSDGIKRFRRLAGKRFNSGGSVLFLCAGEGAEASVCRDVLGVKDITFCDISPVAVATGIKRDPQLKGVVADAENTGFSNESFDLVVVQDGLHHLASPVRGFTEMLRIARIGVIFIEPHDALVGKLIGTKWERNGDAVNYVFRWTRKLVDQVASSYLGPNRYKNHSYSYWHHNLSFAKVGTLAGGGRRGEFLVRTIKYVLSKLLPHSGNCFTAIVIKAL